MSIVRVVVSRVTTDSSSARLLIRPGSLISAHVMLQPGAHSGGVVTLQRQYRSCHYFFNILT